MRLRSLVVLGVCSPALAAAAPEKIAAVPAHGGRIVVLDGGVAYASDDQGASFHSLHPGTDIFDIALGADGTLYALDGDVLDVVRRGTTSTHPEPNAKRVAVSGSIVAVLRPDAIDLSVDGGATFTTRALPPPCPGCFDDWGGSIDLTVAGGSPFVVDTSINTCTSSDFLEWQRLVQIAPRATFQRSLPIAPSDFAATWQFGAFGWMYGVTYANRLVAVSSAGAEPVRGVASVTPTDRLLVASNGRTTIASLGSSLLELGGATARVLDAHARAATLLAVDGDGRPLVYDDKNLWRFSRVTGWTKLALP